MKALHFRSIRTGLLALSLASGFAVTAFAAPVPSIVPAVAGTAAPDITLARAEWAGNNPRQNREYWPRYPNGGRGDHWRGDHWRGDNWRGDRWRGDRWRHRDYYRDNWRWRGPPRRHYGGPSIYFGLGALGVAPAYNYYAPRRTYRVYRGADAHVRWCYERYRSYRSSDNTFQPYNGPRQQCRSPYR